MDWKNLLNGKRPRQTTSTGDHRSEFERDFDRLIFSTPVRRLQDKAQVFPLESLDFIRNRLTHSLEVSSVARGLGIKAAKWLKDNNEIDSKQERHIEVIAATCGLIHDLGNPPFGHSGEVAIQEWFSDKNKHNKLNNLNDNNQHVQDFLKFEGNAQTLRLVAKLQILADFFGLNLTYGTLSAACKYISPSHEAVNGGDSTRKKPGYFASENKLVQEIRHNTGTGEARNPITFLVAAADDIVYPACDIEDAVKKEILSWNEIIDLLKNESTFRKEVRIGVYNYLKTRSDTKYSNDIYASAFRTAAISVMVRSVSEAFENNYNSIMDGTFRNELYEVCTVKDFIKELKKIGNKRIYHIPQTLKLEIMGRRIIQDLMDIFWVGAEKLPKKGQPVLKGFPGKIGALISDNYREVFQNSIKDTSCLTETYHRFQLVTDYICGMTDSFAKRLHTELTNG